MVMPDDEKKCVSSAVHRKIADTRSLLPELLRILQDAIAAGPPATLRAVLERNHADLAQDLPEMFAEEDQKDEASRLAGYERLRRVIEAIYNAGGQGVMPAVGPREVRKAQAASARQRKAAKKNSPKNKEREKIIGEAIAGTGSMEDRLEKAKADLKEAGCRTIKRTAFYDRLKPKKSGS